MAMGHVVLKEFFVDRQVPYFTSYVKKYTDLPFLVRLEERDGTYFAGKFLTASDLEGEQDAEHAEFKTVLLDSGDRRGRGAQRLARFRFGPEGAGRWNLDLAEVDPMLSAAGGPLDAVPVQLPASTPPTAPPPSCTAACRCGASTATWSPPCST